MTDSDRPVVKFPSRQKISFWSFWDNPTRLADLEKAIDEIKVAYHSLQDDRDSLIGERNHLSSELSKHVNLEEANKSANATLDGRIDDTLNLFGAKFSELIGASTKLLQGNGPQLFADEEDLQGYCNNLAQEIADSPVPSYFGLNLANELLRRSVDPNQEGNLMLRHKARALYHALGSSSLDTQLGCHIGLVLGELLGTYKPGNEATGNLMSAVKLSIEEGRNKPSLPFIGDMLSYIVHLDPGLKGDQYDEEFLDVTFHQAAAVSNDPSANFLFASYLTKQVYTEKRDRESLEAANHYLQTSIVQNFQLAEPARFLMNHYAILSDKEISAGITQAIEKAAEECYQFAQDVSERRDKAEFYERAGRINPNNTYSLYRAARNLQQVAETMPDDALEILYKTRTIYQEISHKEPLALQRIKEVDVKITEITTCQDH